jgi:RNA dependent RNA polymerase
VVAKRVARIGQSFGTSTGTVTVQQWDTIADITTPDSRYTFSDGVGRMSPTLARQIADRCVLQLRHTKVYNRH